jgi:hypothetical protein
MKERRKDPARRARFEKVRKAKAEKLGRVCRDWSRRELNALAARMARLELKYSAWAGLSSENGGPLEA